MPAFDIPLENTHPDRHEWCRLMLSAIGAIGAHCHVAVLDTGVDPDWVKARGVPLPLSLKTYDFTRAEEGWREPPDRRHGSRIIADIRESAPLAQISSLRVHGAATDASREDFVRAFEWCGCNGVQVANLSTSFYGDKCTPDAPCILCRTINSVALSSDLFVTIASGDAYTLGQMIDQGEAPHLCPLQHSPLAWGIASSAVVTPGAVVIEEPENGLSFTAGKFTGGVAQLRGALPDMDLFAIRRAIRRTCVPSVHVPKNIGGFGRHCFLMAWLAATGQKEGKAGRLTTIDLDDLAHPSRRHSTGLDQRLLDALRLVCAEYVVPRQWSKARQLAEHIVAKVAPWAPPLDRALALHVLASCKEAIGEDAGAGNDYACGADFLQEGLAAPAGAQ